MERIEIRGMRLTPEVFGPRPESLQDIVARLGAETWESLDQYRARRVETLRGFMGRAAADWSCAAGCECQDCAVWRKTVQDYETYRESEFQDRVVFMPSNPEGETMRRGLARRSAESWEPTDPYGREMVIQLRVEMLALARAGTVDSHEPDCGCESCYRAYRAASMYDRIQERGDSRGAYVLGYQDGLAADSELAAKLRAESDQLPEETDCDCDTCTRYRSLRADHDRAAWLNLRQGAALVRLHSELMELGARCDREDQHE